MPEKIICVVGPTACGKTKLGVLLAKQYDGEVVLKNQEERFILDLLLPIPEGKVF